MKILINTVKTVLLVALVFSNALYAGGKSGQVASSSIVEIEVEPIQTSGFYLGVGTGWMQLKDSFTKEYFETYPLVLQGGYRINNYIAIEGRYVRSMGNVKYEKGNENTENNDDFPTTFSNIAVYVKPIYPIGDFSVYGLLGYGEVSLTDIRNADRTEAGFQWGAGIVYDITEDFSLFADYSNLYDGDGFDGRARDRNVQTNLIVVGVSYAF